MVKMPVAQLRRRMSVWLQQGVLREGPAGTFSVVEEERQQDRDSVVLPDSDDESDSGMASQADQKEEELLVGRLGRACGKWARCGGVAYLRWVGLVRRVWGRAWPLCVRPRGPMVGWHGAVRTVVWGSCGQEGPKAHGKGSWEGGWGLEHVGGRLVPWLVERWAGN